MSRQCIFYEKLNHLLTYLLSLPYSMMSEADQIAYAIKMSLQGDETSSEADTPNVDSSREVTPMDTDVARTSMVSFTTVSLDKNHCSGKTRISDVNYKRSLLLKFMFFFLSRKKIFKISARRWQILRFYIPS